MKTDTKDSVRAVLAFFACLAITGGAMLIVWAVSDLLKVFLR